jgi:diphthine synthase
MVFNLIGIGLDKNSISAEALEIVKNCDLVYLENYTVNFPYSLEELSKCLGISVVELSRENVEDESIIKKSKEKNVALLVYGDALSATTHIQLIVKCKEEGIEYRIFQNASILVAIGRSGLSPYKFGKVTSMPSWKEHKNKPTSFVKYLLDNGSVDAHSLILTDIGLELKDALLQLKISCEKEGFNLTEKIVVLSNAGTQNEKIYFDSADNLVKRNVLMPFCLIVPSNLHFAEEEALKILCVK